MPTFGADPNLALYMQLKPSMKDAVYWKRYVVESDAEQIAAAIKKLPFTSYPDELIYFERGPTAPSILISPGSGGHALVFAELGYHIHARGYNVFVMPKHGPRTISEIMQRQEDALRCIARRCNDRIGVFAEGLGGYAAFYLALAQGSMRSLICQNSPAILTEEDFHGTVSQGEPLRTLMMRLGPFLQRVAPTLKLPISTYLNFKRLIDSPREADIVAAYAKDPNFDRWYPISAVMSLVTTPPPAPLSNLQIPTMFLVPERGLAPAYVKNLFARLPAIKKKLVSVDGGVFWMCSHPREAARVISSWFDESLASDQA